MTSGPDPRRHPALVPDPDPAHQTLAWLAAEAAAVTARNKAAGLPEPAWALALKVSEEAGEVADAFARFAGVHRRAGDERALGEELADVVISAFRLAAELDIHLPDAIEFKFQELARRAARDPR